MAIGRGGVANHIPVKYMEALLFASYGQSEAV